MLNHANYARSIPSPPIRVHRSAVDGFQKVGAPQQRSIEKKGAPDYIRDGCAPKGFVCLPCKMHRRMLKLVEAFPAAKVVELSAVREDTGCLAPCYQLTANRVPHDIHGQPPQLFYNPTTIGTIMRSMSPAPHQPHLPPKWWEKKPCSSWPLLAASFVSPT